MSALAAKLAEARNTGPGGKCSIGILLTSLDEADQKALRTALDSDLHGEQIATAIRSEGHKMSGGTVQRHRKKMCSCDAS